MTMRRHLIAGLAISAALAASSPVAKADLGYTMGGASAGQAAVIFDYLCFTTKHCSAHVNITSAGVEIFTSAAPGQVTGANGTFPVTGTLTVNAGTNLNTSLLALESGGNLATIAGAISASKIQANVAQINGVTPLMGNGVTGTGSQRVTIASDNTAFSVNLGTIGGAATATKQSDGSQKSQIVDGSGNVIASTSNNLNVQCANCSGSGVSTADAATFTATTSLFAGGGGFFQTTATSNPLTTGKQGMFQVTANRALFTNLRDATGTELGTSASPLLASISQGGNSAAVKAASTAALAADPSLVVRINPGDAVATNIAALATSAATTATNTGAPIPTQAPTIDIGAAGISQTTIGTSNAFSLKYLNTTAVDANSGTKSAGTLRVVLATDQPALTNKLLVTPDSVALPANQSVNVNQLAGTATDTNSGVKSAGTMRVVLATDQPALTNKLLVTPDSVALPANQSVNESQINGVTPLMGNGVSGTGSQRVNIASDNTPFGVTPVPTAGQGCTPYHLSGGTTASTNSTSIKPSAVATACRFTLVSTSATLGYLKVYDSVGAPTCSSATGLKHVYPIPAGTTGAGLQVVDLMGEAYVNGLGFCVTGGGGDTDNTNAPTGIFVEASFK